MMLPRQAMREICDGGHQRFCRGCRTLPRAKAAGGPALSWRASGLPTPEAPHIPHCAGAGPQGARRDPQAPSLSRLAAKEPWRAARLARSWQKYLSGNVGADWPASSLAQETIKPLYWRPAMNTPAMVWTGRVLSGLLLCSCLARRSRPSCSACLLPKRRWLNLAGPRLCPHDRHYRVGLRHPLSDPADQRARRRADDGFAGRSHGDTNPGGQSALQPHPVQPLSWAVHVGRPMAPQPAREGYLSRLAGGLGPARSRRRSRSAHEGRGVP